MKLIVATALSALALVSAQAHADTPEGDFINQLAGQGITGDNAALIADGHSACDNYGSFAIQGVLFTITSQGFSMAQASQVVATAWHVLCNKT